MNFNVNTKIYEGLRLHVYKDTVGVCTIGYGHNLQRDYSKQLFNRMGVSHSDVMSGTTDITEEQAEYLYLEDKEAATYDAQLLVPDLYDHPKLARDVLVDLSFNLGYPRLSKFVKMLAAFKARDYSEAARELINSKWYHQVGNRSKELVAALRSI